MLPTLTRQVATRAVDAWALRLLPSPGASHRPDGQISAYDKQVSRLREQMLEALMLTLAEAPFDPDLCKNPVNAKHLLAEHFAEEAGMLAERLRTLERAVGQNPPLWRRYRALISSIRNLADPDSDACAGLLHEICFVLALSGGKSISWARRS